MMVVRMDQQGYLSRFGNAIVTERKHFFHLQGLLMQCHRSIDQQQIAAGERPSTALATSWLVEPKVLSVVEGINSGS